MAGGVLVAPPAAFGQDAGMAIDRRELEGLIPALRRYARGLTGDRATADDIVQECLKLALDRERQFRGPHLKPWVFAILSNVGRSAYRKQRSAPLLADIDPADAGIDPATRVTVLAALSALPDEQRQPLLLSAVEGFSYREIAETLGIPIGTVMSRLSRARTTLAERLDGAEIVALRRTK
jgi:RNA polymerase sigma-70 factor (ECF subfamily)